MSWQDKFREHSTGLAFHLSLTGDQASALAAIEDGTYLKWQSASGRNSFNPAFRALERRGLAEHNPAVRLVGWSHPHIKLRWIYRVTPAGKHALQMLRLANVIPELVEPEHAD